VSGKGVITLNAASRIEMAFEGNADFGYGCKGRVLQIIQLSISREQDIIFSFCRNFSGV